MLFTILYSRLVIYTRFVFFSLLLVFVLYRDVLGKRGHHCSGSVSSLKTPAVWAMFCKYTDDLATQ